MPFYRFNHLFTRTAFTIGIDGMTHARLKFGGVKPLQGSGNIINVASTYSVVAPNQNLYDFGEGIQNFKPIDYIASKSFIPNFTRYIATFYAVNNIRCNAIVPHGIYNNHPEEFLINFSKMSPLGRMCNREELEGPFLFLASNASSYMTGQNLIIDGGWTAW